MDKGKNELSPEIIEAIRNVVKEEIGNAIINQHPFFGMLESEKIFAEEQDRLHEHPLKGVLGRVTKGHEFVNDIYKKQRFERSDVIDLINLNCDEIWDEIVEGKL